MRVPSRSQTPGDVLIALSLAAVVAFVLPMQSYLGNSSLYVFSLSRMLVELGVLFVALAGVVFLLLHFAGRYLRGVLHAVFVAALVCVYLESGILSAGLPEINGGYMAALAVKSRAWIDIGVWSAVTLALIVLVRRLRPYYHWISLAVLTLALLSLFDVHREDAASAEAVATGKGGFEWQRDVVENFRFSANRNVLVFILDSMPGNLALLWLKSSPEHARAFEGFTAFPENVGMHDCTKFGLPGLMTGEYFVPGVSSAADYPMSIFGGTSFIRAYADVKGSEVFFAPDLLPYGWVKGPIARRLPVEGAQKHGWSALLLRSREVPYLSLFDVVVFRLTPYVGKGPFLYSKIRHDPMMGRDVSNFWYEHVMYPILARAETADTPLTLGVFHSRGAHPPLVFDPKGNRYPEVRFGAEATRELVGTPLAHLAELLEVLRKRELYDRSTVVVVADHGVDFAPCAQGHHPSESAILWVKPEGAKGAFAQDARPTGYARVADTMRSLATNRLDAAGLGKSLECGHRLFRYQKGDGFAELTIGPKGEVE